jgi:apolipoprotein N-acyltransferase
MDLPLWDDRRAPKGLLVGLTLLSSILLPLALPNEIFPYGNTVLGLVCLVPVFYAVSLAPSFGFASLLGIIFGIISTGLADFWLMFFQGFAIWTFGGTILGYAGYNSLLFPFLRGFARVSPRYRPFLLAAAWAFYEYLKSVGFLGYPWGLVAYPVWNILPLIQFVDITGIWGLSFLMALVNSLITEGVFFAQRALLPWYRLDFASLHSVGRAAAERPDTEAGPFNRRALFGCQVAFTAVLFVLALGYGVYRLARPIPSEGMARLLLVQQNIDPWNESKAQAESLAINADMTVKGLRESDRPVDLAVWSESSVIDFPDWVVYGDGFQSGNNRLGPFVRSIKTPVLFGAVVVLNLGDRQFMNGAAVVSSEGKILDAYGKIHPVPLAEFIPLYDLKVVQDFFKNVIGLWNTWVPGNRYTVFRVPLHSGGDLSFAAPICFEDAFSDVCRKFILKGADMWLNLTNDYWSKTVSSEVQHFQVARFRAIENRRVLVRSTNGGVTVVVGPWGEIRASLPLFERKSLAVDVPVFKESAFTTYTLFGDYFAWCLACLLLLVLGISQFYKWRCVIG